MAESSEATGFRLATFAGLASSAGQVCRCCPPPGVSFGALLVSGIAMGKAWLCVRGRDGLRSGASCGRLVSRVPASVSALLVAVGFPGQSRWRYGSVSGVMRGRGRVPVGVCVCGRAWVPRVPWLGLPVRCVRFAFGCECRALPGVRTLCRVAFGSCGVLGSVVSPGGRQGAWRACWS